MKNSNSLYRICLSLSVIATFILTSCNKQVHKEGSGVITTAVRNVNAFSSIIADGAFRIETYYDTTPHVEVITDDNIIDDVHTFVQDGRLIIEMNNDVMTYDYTSLTIKVYSTGYSQIELDGAIDFFVRDTLAVSALAYQHDGSGNGSILFNGNTLSIKINGAGDIKAYGVSHNSAYSINGSGEINAIQLQTVDATASIDGAGKIYVYCTGILTANIDGSGDIYYTGGAQVNTDINGSGSVSQY
jgi:hypothetical protein